MTYENITAGDLMELLQHFPSDTPIEFDYEYFEGDLELRIIGRTDIWAKTFKEKLILKIN